MLLTTHYLDEAEALADRVGVIARGRLVEVAVPSALGGRETAPAVVSWTEDGVRRTEATATPTAFVRDLAGRFPGEVPDLAVARPTLEDVYLRMIGEPVMTTTHPARRRPAVAGRRLPHPRGRWSSRSSSGSASRSSSRCCFPVILLVVFGAVLDYDIGGGVTFTQYFMAGIIAAGILGASLQNMAISIATERSDGTLKSLAGTPMPKSAYFVGKIVQVLAVTLLIIAILLRGRGVRLRRRPALAAATGSPSPG